MAVHHDCYWEHDNQHEARDTTGFVCKDTHWYSAIVLRNMAVLIFATFVVIAATGLCRCVDTKQRTSWFSVPLL